MPHRDPSGPAVPAGSYRDPAGPAVIVDPYSSGALFAPAFRDAGVPVVAVTSGPRPPGVYASSYLPADFDEIVAFDGDLAPVIARLREIRPRCVIAGCESGVELADAIAPEVVPEVANTPERAAARRHKGAMAAAAAAAGLPVIAQICTADPAEMEAWIEASGLAGRDLVVKPPKSVCTDGVIRLPGGRGRRKAFDALAGRTNRLGLVNDRVVVQEYVKGVEYVVDTFSHDGVHTVTDVCRYRKIDNGPYMAVYDSMEWLPPDEPVLDELLPYALGVLDAVGVRHGPAHIEIMRTARGPRLIEIGARPHGGGHPAFCQVATGDSQVARTVRQYTGQGPPPRGYELLSPMLVVFHIAQRPGVVRNAAALDAIDGLPTHHFSVRHFADGRYIEMTKDLFSSFDLGFAVFTHPDRDLLWADYRAVRRIEAGLVAGAPAPAPPP
ncbi:ATP-grasp domain-containing protein [Actinomadura terrae]|uniref:ATP-grasp domain-containing protein n=1 Tax=Actinomadura terrae TaxID=604353 RepID=UPI001FA721E1|nr:ATP-grasp domain-containing protein [Actinomadura terrae]